MVIRSSTDTSRRRASLMIDAIVAMALLVIVMVPVARAIASEKRLALSQYERAVALEIVDGEMEALVAGEWRALPAGTSEYRVHAESRANLPPGRFLVTVETNRIRLVWQPTVKRHGGPVSREALVK